MPMVLVPTQGLHHHTVPSAITFIIQVFRCGDEEERDTRHDHGVADNWRRRGGAQNTVDNGQLQDHSAVYTFLDSHTDFVVIPHILSNADVQQGESFSDATRAVKAAFISQTMPLTISRGARNQHPPPDRGIRQRNISTRAPPDFHHMGPKRSPTIVQRCIRQCDSGGTDSILLRFVVRIDTNFLPSRNQDLYITTDLLEVQSSDRIGWFSGRDPVCRGACGDPDYLLADSEGRAVFPHRCDDLRGTVPIAPAAGRTQLHAHVHHHPEMAHREAFHALACMRARCAWNCASRYSKPRDFDAITEYRDAVDAAADETAVRPVGGRGSGRY